MPLPALPPDPEPSVEELRPYLERMADIPDNSRNFFARLS
jgi:hypothetical protein